LTSHDDKYEFIGPGPICDMATLSTELVIYENVFLFYPYLEL